MEVQYDVFLYTYLNSLSTGIAEIPKRRANIMTKVASISTDNFMGFYEYLRPYIQWGGSFIATVSRHLLQSKACSIYTVNCTTSECKYTKRIVSPFPPILCNEDF